MIFMNQVIKNSSKYLAKNYKSIPILIEKGKDIFLFDKDGTKYYDFMAGYSAVNQGHCHPRIVNALKKQSEKLTLCSRAFHNDKLLEYGEFMCNLFKYDQLLPTNTGVEAGETAIKLARSWAYNVKNIDQYQAKIVLAQNNFWGRTITAASSSSDPLAYENFGPFTPGFSLVTYNDITSLEKLLENDPNICAVMLEPIQGEAGIIIPSCYYLKKVRALCDKHNVLLICDEVQTGLGRMGSLLASNYYSVKPDILLLGKALSGGMFPVSAVLANNQVMDCMYPNTHGSTFGGNPLACAVGIEAVKTLQQEQMIENSKINGYEFRKNLKYIVKNKPVVSEVRGLGLMNAIQFANENKADQFINKLRDEHVLTKVTKSNTVRLTPPLTIRENDLSFVCEKIKKVIDQL